MDVECPDIENFLKKNNLTLEEAVEFFKAKFAELDSLVRHVAEQERPDDVADGVDVLG